jgi:hypothetical protein
MVMIFDCTSPESKKKKWELTDARIVAEVRQRGTLPEGELMEEEIARIAVEMTAEGTGDTRSE